VAFNIKLERGLDVDIKLELGLDFNVKLEPGLDVKICLIHLQFDF